MFKRVKCENIPHRRRFLMSFGIVGAVMSVLPFSGTVSATEAHGHTSVINSQVVANQRPRSDKVSQTAAALRNLWVDHIFWVRNVSIATFNKNNAAMKTADKRVVANAQLIAATIEPFYGATAQEHFFKLLAGHYGAVSAYLAAVTKGDASAQAGAIQSLTLNAEDIAIFLSKANPYLPQDAVNSLLLAHGGHHIKQIQQLQEQNYDSEAKTWEEMKDHVYQIADATAVALGKQFEERFRY
jgi:hypothetical protein